MTDSNQTRPPGESDEIATRTLNRLRARLLAENEGELLHKIRLCGEPILLQCACCSKRREAKMRCRKKWCPRCQRSLAAERADRMGRIVEQFRSPLFLTLTMPNEFDLKAEPIKKLKRAITRLRRTVGWKTAVRGGLMTIEVTNKGKGYHVHAHFVLDCDWLGFGAPAPVRNASRSEVEHACMLAKMTAEENWAWAANVPKAVLHMSRCNRKTIAREVVKYAVKGSELVDQKEPIGDILRAIDAGRMLGTFGHCQRKTRNHLPVLDTMKEEDDRPRWEKLPEGYVCCKNPNVVPAQFVAKAKARLWKRTERAVRKAAQSRDRMRQVQGALAKPFRSVAPVEMSRHFASRPGKKTAAEFRAETARSEALTKWAVSDPSRALKAALRGS